MLDKNYFKKSHSSKVLPPVYFLVTVVIMVGLHFLAPIGMILHPPATYLGALLISIGVAVVVWAATTFSKVGTPIKPFEKSTHLVTEGMYRITRNPMYLSMVMILLGIAVLLGTISPFLPIPLFDWLIQTIFIRFEEVALERTFGDEYIEYKKKVRRWL